NDNGATVVSAFHHPYQWLEPVNGRAFRGRIEESSDLVLTGHEHSATNRRTSTLKGEEFTHVEGAALQEPDSGPSGFNVFVLDGPARKQLFVEFVYKGGRYVPAHDEIDLPAWTELPLNKIRTRGTFVFTTRHSAVLEDIGLQLSPPGIETAVLSDLFV